MAESEEQTPDSEPTSSNNRLQRFIKRRPKTSIAIGIFVALFVIGAINEDPEPETVTLQDASSASWNGDAPKLDLSPGSVNAKATSAQVCSPNFASAIGDPTPKTRKGVLSAYGITDKNAQSKYTVVRVVPASLAGDNAARNLWPVPNANIAAQSEREALGAHLRDLVCAQQIDLATAQRSIEGSLENAKTTYGTVAVVTTTTTLAPSTTTSTTATPVTAAPTTTPTTTATTRATTATTAKASGDGYTNVDGNHVPSPVAAPSPPAGATAQCNDGTYSFSQNHSGTCSHHGGVDHWL